MTSEPKATFSRAEDVEDAASRAMIVASLVSLFGDVDDVVETRERAFELAESIDDQLDRAKSLKFFVNPPRWDDPRVEFRARLGGALRVLTLPEARLVLLADLVEFDSTRWREVLAEVDRCDDEQARFDALSAIPTMDLDTRDFGRLRDSVLNLSSAQHRAALASNLVYIVPTDKIDELIDLGNVDGDPLLANSMYTFLEQMAPDEYDRASSIRNRRARNRQIEDPVIRAKCQISAMSMIASDEDNVITCNDVLDACGEVDDDHRRAELLEKYSWSVPGGVVWGSSRILELARSFASERLRARALRAALVSASNDLDTAPILEEVERLTDPWAVAHVLTFQSYFRRESVLETPGNRSLMGLVEAVPVPAARAGYALELVEVEVADPERFIAIAEAAIGETERARDVVMLTDDFSRLSGNSRLIPAALTACTTIDDPRWKIRGIATLSRHLSGPDRRREQLAAADVAFGISDTRTIGPALRDIDRYSNCHSSLPIAAA